MIRSPSTWAAALAALTTIIAVDASNVDLFNYDFPNDSVPGGGGTDYGQPNWGSVTCSDLDVCTGYPDKFLSADFPSEISMDETSNCRWCPEGGPENCGLHRQSPINLLRDRGIVGGENAHECIDWHYIKAEAGTCEWYDYQDQFQIMRHALRFNVPQLPSGEVNCEKDGQRNYPRCDYSKGFPDWWWLDHVDIQVPSNHVQEGKRYDAEVTLAHFYEIEHPKNQLGYVSVFLESYDGVDSWPFLDKLICQWRLEEEKVRSECGLDPAPDYGRCRLFRGQKPSQTWLNEAGLGVDTKEPQGAGTPMPTATTANPASSPSDDKGPNDDYNLDDKFYYQDDNIQRHRRDAAFDCEAYDVPYDRMCASCCNETRSESSFCWKIYDHYFPGELMESACHACCPDGPKAIGPARSEKASLPKTIQCSSVDSTMKICSSCCTNPPSTTSFCNDIYEINGNDMEQICYYCCSEAKDFAIGRTRNLRDGAVKAESKMSLNGGNQKTAPNEKGLPPGAKVMYMQGQPRIVRKENFIPSNESDQAHFDRIYADFKRREAQKVFEVDYTDVPFYEYEWLVKVGTEYYFRYEGTMLVPPCFEVVHWRTYKDPIRINKRQTAELNRLLAWRRSPSGSNRCSVDTAGRLRPSDKRVKVDRDLQYLHLQHRLTFCECKDWPSKFEGDRDWCKGWRDNNGEYRFYQTPYNFDTGGKF